MTTDNRLRAAAEAALTVLNAGFKISPESELHDRFRAALAEPQQFDPSLTDPAKRTAPPNLLTDDEITEMWRVEYFHSGGWLPHRNTIEIFTAGVRAAEARMRSEAALDRMAEDARRNGLDYADPTRSAACSSSDRAPSSTSRT